MTAHELAKKLLEGPDILVARMDRDGDPDTTCLDVEVRNELAWTVSTEARFNWTKTEFIYIF